MRGRELRDGSLIVHAIRRCYVVVAQVLLGTGARDIINWDLIGGRI